MKVWHSDTSVPMDPTIPPGSIPTVRAGAFIVLAVIALFEVVPLQRPSHLALVMLVAAVVDVTSFFVVPAETQRFTRSALDVLTVLGVIVVEVELWQPAMMALVADVVWQLSRWSRAVLWIPMGGVIICTTVAGVLDAPGWLATSLVLLAIIFVHVYLSSLGHFRESKIHEDLTRVLRSSGAVAYEVDLRTERYTSVAGPVEEITGWTKSEWTTMPQAAIIHPDDLADFWLHEKDLSSEQFLDRKARFRRPDGTYIWLRDVSRVVRTNGRWVLYGFSLDVTELESAYQTIRHQAEHDQLTGLSNRLVLSSALEARLSDKRGDRASFAIMMLDMDRFKEINDRFGHDVGDEVLCELADRLRASVRPEDLVARIGGDEFAVIAGHVATTQQADVVARRIASAVDAPFSVRGMNIRAGLSIGVAIAEDVEDEDELLRRADAAMYKAKRAGVDHAVYVGNIDGSGVSEVVLASSLAKAIENNEFEVWFQPKVNMETHEVAGVEALARWHHPELGLMLPDKFLHLVHLSDVGVDFNRMVFEQALDFARKSNENGGDLTVAVNISVHVLYDESFASWLQRALRSFQVDARQLVLEITEQDIMEEVGSVPVTLDRLAQMGVALSIDDFGTGYSSLARLRDLPVSEIKIDRRFVGSAPDDQDDRTIVESIIDLAGNLGLDVVAEGVERLTEAEILVGAGCTVAQGYLFGQALPADKFFSAHQPPQLRLIDMAEDTTEETA